MTGGYDSPVRAGPILAGVDGGAGTAEVVRSAARLAASAGAELVVAHVVTTTNSMLPEIAALNLATAEDDALAALVPEICIALIGTAQPWRVVTATGNPGIELARLAERLHPAAIVVGADSSGWLARLRRGFDGSVPAQLSRRQTARIVVIPGACSRPRRTADQVDPVVP
ncbi:MAG: universal stress protein [Actinobacteria bacterium]|nr:universal stress protein [Actinomycetota bacterium]